MSMHQVKRNAMIPKIVYVRNGSRLFFNIFISTEILMQRWGERIFSNRQLGTRVYIRIIMTMVLE
jgi:hypothetical protein